MSDKKHRAPPPTWSPLSPTPLTDTSTVGRKLPGQNPGMTAITDWVRKKYEGEYTKKYDKHPTGDFKVDHGQLTFDAEGTEGGRHHTRELHWPGTGSGPTIGRGYDLGFHKKNAIRDDMLAAGVAPKAAEAFAKGAGKRGGAGKTWANANAEKVPEITPGQQKSLFETEYARKYADVERIGKKRDTAALYGQFDPNKAHPAIGEFLTDLTYRGDYDGKARTHVQKAAVEGDLPALAKAAANRSLWKSNLDTNRYQRRVAYLNEAVAEQKIEQSLPYTFAAPLERLGDPTYQLDGTRTPGAGPATSASTKAASPWLPSPGLSAPPITAWTPAKAPAKEEAP